MTTPAKIDEGITDERTKKFVAYLLLGRKDNEAARLAGFEQPRVAAVRLLQDPLVLAEIEKAVSGRMRGELAPKALNTLADILDSKSASRTLKLAAAKTVLDRAGYVPPKAPDRMDDPLKSMAEQTAEELKAFMHAAQVELTNRATVVVDGTAKDVTPPRSLTLAQNALKAPAKRGQRPKALPSGDDAAAAGLLD